MNQNDPPEASGAKKGRVKKTVGKGGCPDAIKIDPGALLETSGGEKNSLVLAGAPPEKFLDHFSSS